MSCKFFSISPYDYLRNTCLHYIDELELVLCLNVMIVTWWTASGIILHHRSNAYELFTYCALLIYFTVATVTITTKLLLLPLLPYYFATKYFAADIKFPSVVELTTQLLILENILWLPLCRINKFGLNTLPSKTVAIPYTCGLSMTRRE